MPKARKKPTYCLHKPTGQAYTRVHGRMIYLGLWDSEESRARFAEELESWSLRQDAPRATLTLDTLAIRFIAHADGYYRKNGEPTCEANNIRIALRPLVRLFGSKRVAAFQPTDLKSVRNEMIKAGCVRGSINRQIGRIKRMFRWGVEEGIVPPVVPTGVSALSGLRAGRSGAKESAPVRPVSAAAVDAIEPHVSRQVWAMIQIQLMTGARPGEVVIMRGCDLNTSGRVWEYVPASHKTEHHGRRRIIFIGPRAQAIVRDFLKADTRAFLFSPADARAEFDAERRENRKTPMTPSQAARKREKKPRRQPGERYTVASYGAAVRKACEAAFGMPKELRNVPDTVKEPKRSELRKQASEWREANCWHPHQLRHSAATNLRREFGLDTARTVLGHSSMAVAEIYAEQDLAKAREAAGMLG